MVLENQNIQSQIEMNLLAIEDFANRKQKVENTKNVLA